MVAWWEAGGLVIEKKSKKAKMRRSGAGTGAFLPVADRTRYRPIAVKGATVGPRKVQVGPQCLSVMCWSVVSLTVERTDGGLVLPDQLTGRFFRGTHDARLYHGV